MCIKCDVMQFNAAAAQFSQDMAEALVDAFGIVEHMKARGIALDADEQKVYDKLLPYVTGARADDEPGQTREGIVEALKQAFPGAQVIVGSPDEVEAMIDKATNGNKKTH